MRFRDQITMARRNLKRQKGRTRLTLLSIIIGAFAVISVIILSFVADQAVSDFFENSGELYSITAQRDGADAIIDDALVDRIAAVDGVSAITPALRLFEFSAIRMGDRTVNTFNAELEAQRPNGATIFQIEAGRDLDASDTGAQALMSKDIAEVLTDGNPEALIGSTVFLVAGDFYQGPDLTPEDCEFGDGSQPPVCAAVEIPVTVVGLMAGQLKMFFPLEFGVAQKRLTFYFYDPGCDPDSDFWANDPGASQAQPRVLDDACLDGSLRSDSIDEVEERGYDRLKIRVASDDAVDFVSAALVADFGMRNQRDVQDEGRADFGFAVGRDELREIQSVASVVTLVFLLVGGISLLVSAIGVINTMIMATLERTREIGVMRALGASRRDVTRVFTIESGLLGFLGGLWGLVLASVILMSLYFTTDGFATFGLGFSLDLGLVLTAILPASLVVGLTTFIGVVAGVMPARRAAKLDPVESLRYE